MTDASVIFVHGVGGPVPGWDDALRAAVRRRGAELVLATTTVEYAHVLDGEGRSHPPAPVLFDADQTGRLAGLDRNALLSLVASVAAEPGGTDGAARLRPPLFLPAGLLVRWPWSGMAHARAYRGQPTLRSAARAAIAAQIDAAAGSGPIIVLAHSLGSVIVLDLLHRHNVPVDLLVSLGSPLGVDDTWGRAFEGRPLPPGRVGAWLNVVNTRDPIPWNRGAGGRFPDAVDAFITRGRLPVGPGGAHDPATYTGSDLVAAAVIAAAALRPLTSAP
jgi:pimeloyl-ACP methyl ester carboxylesterase